MLSAGPPAGILHVSLTLTASKSEARRVFTKPLPFPRHTEDHTPSPFAARWGHATASGHGA